MMTVRKLTAAAVLAALAAAPSIAAAQAQPLPPQRPGAVAPADKDDNPAATAPSRGPAATLERLFERLAAAKSPEEAKGIANLIQRRWARSGSATADLLMTRAQTAMKEKRLELAIELLDRVISLDPDWAEGWNQRANALFLAGDPIRSIIDIGETLKREPRHYGAMMGLGTILRQQGDDKRAMVAYRRALEIYPQLEAVKSAVDALKTEVDGRDA
ncbi:MAG: tetratricopeptide repeat protein [Bosea sp. (in: a-proteobacteria)]|uniref:tetratricopeptide repeat protein n=1 Tax=Bosea sp. (in: a-proteobacteria) TaxID=1871050 RepID=UPI002734B798|nr:tetratricopeptide repeat protein [Bosea sp. (in: a-proteobacteria)]MDP3255801.1 tetratricopeptide repeat protein [Bosea sp. (in: a-proteobacteria)]MDP3320557.1 tetratricopeptide repeat protein [Bosea sp. (in: a-proteobacteria)]